MVWQEEKEEAGEGGEVRVNCWTIIGIWKLLPAFYSILGRLW